MTIEEQIQAVTQARDFIGHHATLFSYSNQDIYNQHVKTHMALDHAVRTLTTVKAQEVRDETNF